MPGGGILNCVVILLRNFFRLTVRNLHFRDKKYRNLTCCEKTASIFWNYCFTCEHSLMQHGNLCRPAIIALFVSRSPTHCCEPEPSSLWLTLALSLAHSGSLTGSLWLSLWLTLAQILNFLSIVPGCLIYRGKEAIDIYNGILMAPLDYMISKEDTCREIWKIKYVQ